MMSKQDSSRRDRGTFIAMILLVSSLLGILFLIGQVFPNLLAIVGIIFAFGLLIGLQYLVWGRWMMDYLKKRVPDDSEEDEKFLSKYGPQ